MDTQTYARKVLAFLHPYYQRKYGYVFGGAYSVCLDEKGERLLIFWNGRFRRAGDEQDDPFGHPDPHVPGDPARRARGHRFCTRGCSIGEPTATILLTGCRPAVLVQGGMTAAWC